MSEFARYTRRQMLVGRFAKTWERTLTATSCEIPTTRQVAVIQGRHCLAYRSLTCTTCYERCSEPGAIQIERGIPSVTAAKCTGCSECHDVCPAPTNAVLLVKTRQGRPT